VGRVAFATPSSWTDAQRFILREAAEGCGLEVQQLVAAPLATALARFGPRGQRRTLSVHFGEGGAEAAVVEQAGHVFDLLSSASDPNLGGIDIDMVLIEAALSQFEKETGFLVPESPAVFERVRDAVSRARFSLNESLEAEIRVDRIADAGLTKVDLEQKLTRARMLALSAPHLERAVELALTTLAARNLKPGDLDEILLFGVQASWSPLARKLAERLGREPTVPDVAGDSAAIGAALVADGAATLGRYVMAGAVGATVGVGLPGGGFKRVIERNLALPIERGYTVQTTQPGERDLEIHLFQGEHPEAFSNEYIGAVVAGPLPPGSLPGMRIALTVMVDASGAVSVRGRDVSNGKPVPVVLDRSRTAEQARRALLPS
jgi:molecular chaperone DnaK